MFQVRLPAMELPSLNIKGGFHTPAAQEAQSGSGFVPFVQLSLVATRSSDGVPLSARVWNEVVKLMLVCGGRRSAFSFRKSLGTSDGTVSDGYQARDVYQEGK